MGSALTEQQGSRGCSHCGRRRGVARVASEILIQFEFATIEPRDRIAYGANDCVTPLGPPTTSSSRFAAVLSLTCTEAAQSSSIDKNSRVGSKRPWFFVAGKKRPDETTTSSGTRVLRTAPITLSRHDRPRTLTASFSCATAEGTGGVTLPVPVDQTKGAISELIAHADGWVDVVGGEVAIRYSVMPPLIHCAHVSVEVLGKPVVGVEGKGVEASAAGAVAR